MKRLATASLILLILGMALAYGWTVRADGGNRDLERLLSASDAAIASDKRVIIKHTGPYMRYSDETDFLRIASRISAAFDLPVPFEIQHEKELLLFKPALSASERSHASLLWIGFPDGSTELSLSAEALSESGLPELLTLQQQWTQALQALDIRAEWNIIIQGALADSLDNPNSLQAWLSSSLQARETARYQDAGSLSISYLASALHSAAASSAGKEKMNLQVAVHQDSVTHGRRITIATPAISIEY